MIRISPEQFKDAFLQIASATQAESLACWNETPNYTAHMREKFLPALAPLLGMEVYSGDYYTLDCIYFAAQDREHFGSHVTYATCLNIALEHENVIQGTATEMNKLQLFNAPLKILITYAGTEAERTKHLASYAKIIRAADIFGDFVTLRRQLVIFGNRDDCNIKWHFYAYEKDGFRELT